ncbi:MAG: ThiF family adenylyltransferase, partial [Massilibacteroides sp.]|nr:ThiF family adenylyltransferase [Massilibacteroides sp.]
GSWCAESLVRSGISHLTIVDSDRVCVTNVNRQLMATTQTIGQVKVDVLKARLLEINPKSEIVALQQIYDASTADSFQLNNYDYIIDAIDSLENKADLICRATRTSAVLFSSMGAALKMNPLKIQVAEFWEVRGCPLAAALRRKMKKGEMPAKKFNCVFSEEVLENKGASSFCDADKGIFFINKETDNPLLADHVWLRRKAQINGTIAHTTAIFGFTLAGLVMQDIYEKEIG